RGPVLPPLRQRGGARGNAGLPGEAPPTLGHDMTLARRTTAPKQDRSRQTRQRLLEATVRCLAEHGWSAATVAVIAEEAGISRGALQHHFPTREALVVAALEYVFEERRKQIEQLPHPTTTGAERVHHVVTTLMDTYNGELFRAALYAWTAAA